MILIDETVLYRHTMSIVHQFPKQDGYARLSALMDASGFPGEDYQGDVTWGGVADQTADSGSLA